MKQYDLIVIGAGSGLDVASAYNSRGEKVALIEPGPLGGTCLNRGCIPSKMLIHRAQLVEDIKDSERFGIDASVEDIDYREIVEEVNENVGEDAEAILKGVENSENYDLYREKAEFKDDKVVEVDGEKLTADKIVVAAGSKPFIPPVEGIEETNYLTSKDALELEEKPDSMVIVGGGYIASELAFFFNAMGTEVTIVELGDKLLKREDRDVSDRFTEIAKEQYNVVLGASAQKVSGGETKTVELDNGESLEADQILMATGRRPNTDSLKLEVNTSIELDERGFIETDEYLATSVEGVYALGDIAGNYMFKHSANLEAEYVYKNLLGMEEEIDYTAMPHAVFSNPQIAGVGKTEQQLEEEETEYVKSVYSYENSGMGQALKEEDGFVKVLASEDGEILGVHIIGPEASTLIHEVLPVIRIEGNVSDIKDTIHIHPALSEVVDRAFQQL